MKVSRLKLNSFLHFREGLVIDLTYPEGHPRAGQPLDKICLIGQSGTGKTTLLNLIKYFVCEDLSYDRSRLDEKLMKVAGVECFYTVDEKQCSKMAMGDGQFQHKEFVGDSTPKVIEAVKEWRGAMEPLLRKSSPLLMSFPFCVVDQDDVGSDQLALNKETGELEETALADRRMWDFTPASILSVWNIVFDAVEQYRLKYESKRKEYFDKMLMESEKSVDIIGEFKAWQESFPNPLQELADGCLAEVLDHFNLQIETDLNKYDNHSSRDQHRTYVLAKNKSSGELIEYRYLSTGTKQVLLTAIPLFYLKPKNTVILFDQPETSLYPNIQRMLPDFYLRCTKNGNNQFCFATHSPIVASSFDPWEVVELEFAPGGTVQQKEYFTGRRHVDNYHINPKMLDWSSSFKLLFNVSADGGEDRIQGLMEVVKLGRKIKESGTPGEREALWERYRRLAQTLDWKIP